VRFVPLSSPRETNGASAWATRFKASTAETALRTAAEGVNAGLFKARAAAADFSGSTLVALLCHDEHYACVWAGDSRAYRWRAGQLSRLTRDHSIVQELIDGGDLSEAERTGHPHAHVITRAVGAAAELNLDQAFAPLEVGDVFLLCSDGLTGCVLDDEIAAHLAGGDADSAAEALLSLALSRSPSDNVSLVVVCAGGRS